MSLTVRSTRMPPTILKHFRSGSLSFTWCSVSRTSLESQAQDIFDVSFRVPSAF